MQTKLNNVSVIVEIEDRGASVEPLVLDVSVLDQVAGGCSPKGTWAIEASIVDEGDSPKGTW